MKYNQVYHWGKDIELSEALTKDIEKTALSSLDSLKPILY